MNNIPSNTPEYLIIPSGIVIGKYLINQVVQISENQI